MNINKFFINLIIIAHLTTTVVLTGQNDKANRNYLDYDADNEDSETEIDDATMVITSLLREQPTPQPKDNNALVQALGYENVLALASRQCPICRKHFKKIGTATRHFYVLHPLQ